MHLQLQAHLLSQRRKSYTTIIQTFSQLISPSSSSSSSSYSKPHFHSPQCSTTTTPPPSKEHHIPETPNSSLSWRVEKLPRSKPIISAFQSWMSDGLAIRRNDIFHAVNRLRKLNMNRRALQVMEWVIREKPYKINEFEYASLLEFTIKLHGTCRGETLFTHVPPEFQNGLLYNNLVLGCLDKGKIRLSLAYMKKMRQLSHPISHLVYNRLIILHSSPRRRKLIRRILTQMKADGVAPHPSTYNILLKLEADDHNVEGVGKVFDEMKRAKVDPNEITYCILATAHAVARLYSVSEAYVEAVERSQTGNNWSTLDVLLILYGYLRKEKKLEETWAVVKGLLHVRTKSFILAIEAFGRIGRMERAEELWLEMKLERELKFTEQFNAIISVYCKHGLVDKASELFNDMGLYGCKANAITYQHLAFGCLKAGLVDEALKTLDVGADLTASAWVRRSTPWLETTLSMVEIFAEMGDVENANKLFAELKESRYSRYTFVYNALLKAYVKGRIYPPGFLRRMILGGARPDAETYSLVRLVEEFRP